MNEVDSLSGRALARLRALDRKLPPRRSAYWRHLDFGQGEGPPADGDYMTDQEYKEWLRLSQAKPSPTSDRALYPARSVYGSKDSPRNFDRVIQLLELGSAPSTMELAFASAQRALYDTAALLAASWRADVASPPVGHSASEPAAPGARAAQGGRPRARRGRGGQGRKRGS